MSPRSLIPGSPSTRSRKAFAHPSIPLGRKKFPKMVPPLITDSEDALQPELPIELEPPSYAPLPTRGVDRDGMFILISTPVAPGRLDVQVLRLVNSSEPNGNKRRRGSEPWNDRWLRGRRSHHGLARPTHHGLLPREVHRLGTARDRGRWKACTSPSISIGEAPPSFPP